MLSHELSKKSKQKYLKMFYFIVEVEKKLTNKQTNTQNKTKIQNYNLMAGITIHK